MGMKRFPLNPLCRFGCFVSVQHFFLFRYRLPMLMFLLCIFIFVFMFCIYFFGFCIPFIRQMSVLIDAKHLGILIAILVIKYYFTIHRYHATVWLVQQTFRAYSKYSKLSL